MTSRERVRAALSGERPDRVPFALGSFYQPLYGAPDADELFGSDVRFVECDAPRDQEAFLDYLDELPADVHVGHEGQLRTYQEWGYRPERGDEGQLLARLRLTAEIVRGLLPDVRARMRESGVEERIRSLHDRGLAAAAAPPHLGGQLLETSYRLRGFQRFMLDLVEHEDLAVYLLDQLTAMLAENAALLAEAGADVLLLDDDVASCTGLLMSPELWRRLFKPRWAAIIAEARTAAPDLLVFYHSDGNFAAIARDLVEIGVDVLNPLQPDCMDARALRRALGPRPALWGTVGTAESWQRATPEAVREEVARRIAELGPAGLLLAPAYDLDYAPRENVEAFVAAVLEGRSPG